MANEPSPEPIYEERYCAFVDILGFSELIGRLAKGSMTFQELRQLLDTIHSPVFVTHPIKDSDIRTQSISDALRISAKCNERGLQHVMGVLYELSFKSLANGYFVRGSLVKGRLYHDSKMVFGEAMVRAYLLERDVVRYPRIMISSDVLSDIRASTLQMPAGKLVDFVIKATDGPWYLDILKTMYDFLTLEADKKKERMTFFNQIADQIQKRFDEASDNPRHFEKVEWFARYWNFYAFRTGIKGIMRPSYDGQIPVMV
jgi:hypothetical protein